MKILLILLLTAVAVSATPSKEETLGAIENIITSYNEDFSENAAIIIEFAIKSKDVAIDVKAEQVPWLSEECEIEDQNGILLTAYTAGWFSAN